MHVAINALFLVPPMGGLETYLRELARELLSRPDAPRLSIFLTPAGHAKLSQEDWAADAMLIPAPRLGRNGARAVSELLAVGPLADRRGADVIHSLAMTGPLFSRAQRVVTIPDVIWITQSDHTPTQRLWRAIVPVVTRRADAVIAIADSSRAAVAEHLGVADDRLFTTHLGARVPTVVPTPEPSLRRELGLSDGPIVLNVGQRGGHRNLERLIAAVARVRETVPGAILVLPGYAPPEYDEALRAVARQHGIESAVHFSGFVSNEDLDGLYRAAGAFVMPSFEEGFGLPVLEAMQRGAPVACTADSSPSEIAGEAALTFDPRREDDIAAAITRLLTEPELAERLRALGRTRAEQYTWSRCANQTMAVYEHVLA